MKEITINLSDLACSKGGFPSYWVNPRGDNTVDWMVENNVESDYLSFLKHIPAGSILNIMGYPGSIYLDNNKSDVYYAEGTSIGEGVKLVWKPLEKTIQAIKLEGNYLNKNINKERSDAYPFKNYLTDATWEKVFEEGIALWDINRILKNRVELTFMW